MKRNPKKKIGQRKRILASFPGLIGIKWRITSRRTRLYNCLAWAAGETHRWWEPKKGAYWPKNVIKLYTLPHVIAAYQAHGFEECAAECRDFDPDYDKIVIYEKQSRGVHAARLLENGKWTSKLGSGQDIRHPTPEVISGNVYGVPRVYMRRRIATK